eukprot:5348411-Prymnesium_polylepis.1
MVASRAVAPGWCRPRGSRARQRRSGPQSGLTRGREALKARGQCEQRAGVQPPRHPRCALLSRALGRGKVSAAGLRAEVVAGRRAGEWASRRGTWCEQTSTRGPTGRARSPETR